MSGWQLLIWGAVCGMGVTAFLKVVASEIERAEANLRQVEKALRKDLKKRQQMGSQEPSTSTAVAEAA